ncbi:MAG: inositol monophosphatase family protein [Candidatus Dormibacteraceae bacterium]
MNSKLESSQWLHLFHEIAAEVRTQVLPYLGTAAGAVAVGVGAGGDQTMEVDRIAEMVVLNRLRELAAGGVNFSVLSEEEGHLNLGAEYPLVVVDPIDGSHNALRGLPMAAVMLSQLGGPTVDSTEVGVVHNLYSGERWHAMRGRGLHRNGEKVEPQPFDLSDLVVATSSRPESARLLAPRLAAGNRLRIIGSVALSLVHTATGGVDFYFSTQYARTFDITSGWLMLQEVGGTATNLTGEPIAQLPVSLKPLTQLVCAAHPVAHQIALEMLS